jgi:Glutathione S-transferase
MLEEISYNYKVTKVDLSNDEQFKPEYLKINPFRKIPVITDHENNKSIFESGTILMYLADKSGKLYNEKNRLVINQWLMAQMRTISPMIDQHHQFHHYNPGKSEFAEEKYFKITKTIY